ncbi:MAG: hypothetical protein PHC93_04385, partial [Candidatus Omnitrophica bacterium]|nr:hypothetical protein [Candidatus Omnitrophota bacterium]
GTGIANPEQACAYKEFAFDVYQQAVSVTRRDSSTGQILTNGINLNSVFNQVLTGQTITLDKTSNRGDDLHSYWSFYKLIAGNWTLILPGSGFSLGGGQTTSSDTIDITWIDEGQYGIKNTCMGSAGGLSNLGYDIHEIYVGPDQPLVAEIEWCNIITNVIESPLDTDPVTSNNPLTSKQPFIIRAEAYADASTGSWIWVDPDGVDPPLTRVMSATDWRDEIDARCNISCNVYSNGQLITSRTGWGPHDIELMEGPYTVQFLAKYKSTILSNQSQQSTI